MHFDNEMNCIQQVIQVSMAVRRRLPMSKAFASAQHNSYRISALGGENDLKWNNRCAHSSTNKQVKPIVSGTMVR